MSSNERDPVITTGGEALSIFEIMQRYRNDGSCEHVIQDALRRLSQIDSQATEPFSGPCAGCGHNNYDAERQYCAQRWMEGRYSVVCGCPCAKHNSLTNAATRMRDVCVTRVRELGQQWYGEAKKRGAAFSDKGRLAETIAAELESLTLDQAEHKR